MAPEILNGIDGKISYSGDKVDVFSLGVILFCKNKLIKKLYILIQIHNFW